MRNHAALPVQIHITRFGPRATAACVKLCWLDKSMATNGRLALPFKSVMLAYGATGSG